MQVNFFQWIREGVRQAVLLGVSDAVEQIGVPEEDGPKTGPFIESIQQNAVAIGASSKKGGSTKSSSSSTSSSSKRRRLGRSLKEIEDEK